MRPERTELKTIRETYRFLLVAEAGDAEAQRSIDPMARINRYEGGDLTPRPRATGLAPRPWRSRTRHRLPPTDG